MTDSASSPTLSELAQVIQSAATFNADASQLMVRLARLVAQGRPASPAVVSGIVDELGIDQRAAASYLTAYAERDLTGAVIGAFPGVTLRPTAHHFTTDAAEVWAWCVLDTLELPVVLDQEARVVSYAPRSKQPVRFTATPDGVSDIQPASAVASFPGVIAGTNRDESHDLAIHVADVTSVEEVWKAFCHYAHAFPSQREAEAWLGDRTDVVFTSLHEAFEVVRGVADRLLGAES